jgi:cysteine desulfurase/selenocysteine lyase
VRDNFPLLKREVHGKPLVYLDSANTGQKPAAVIEATDDFYRRHNANVSRAVHTLGSEATDAYEGARRKLAAFLNVQRDDLVLCSGTTFAINLVAYSWALPRLKAGDAILLTRMEHHANIVPWQLVARTDRRDDQGRRVAAGRVAGSRRAACSDDAGREDARPSPTSAMCWARSIRSRDLPRGAQARHRHASSTARRPRRTSRPRHSRRSAAISTRSPATRCAGRPAPARCGRAASTSAGDAALHRRRRDDQGSALRRHRVQRPAAQVRGRHAQHRRLHRPGRGGRLPVRAGHGHASKHAKGELLAHATEELRKVDGLRIFGEARHKAAVISFQVEGAHAHDLATLLDLEGVAVRSGQHCAHPLLHWFGVAATCRASLAFYNTHDEVDAFVAALRKVRRLLA